MYSSRQIDRLIFNIIIDLKLIAWQSQRNDRANTKHIIDYKQNDIADNIERPSINFDRSTPPHT